MPLPWESGMAILTPGFCLDQLQLLWKLRGAVSMLSKKIDTFSLSQAEWYFSDLRALCAFIRKK